MCSRVTPEITDCLMATRHNMIEGAGILATRLCSHMKDVDVINSSKLDALTGKLSSLNSIPENQKISKNKK